MSVNPGTLLGRYHIVSPLGAGGMGEVYLAHDTQLGRRVAIKFPTVTSDEHHSHARFLREARAVSVLSHSHIATIYDYGETPDGQPYLVMELVNGESLSDLMCSSSLTVKRSIEIIADVAEALEEAHRLGIIHRDIKPSNVMINERGEVKVLDFGLVKQLHEQSAGIANPDAQTLINTRTQSGIVVGTPLYLSPEQAVSAPVDGRSDIFALGALLYECITGRSAFVGKGVIELTAQIIHVDPPAPSTINPHVPPELDRITLKALAKKPEERYQSARELLDELQQVRRLLSDDDAHQTQRISPLNNHTAHPSALRTFSDMLQRPRISIGRLLMIGAAVGIVTILLWYVLLRSKPYVPSAEAKGWYDKGTNAMRDGAYDQASKAFQSAIEIDDDYALAHARLAEAWVELDYAEKAKDEMLRVNTLVPDRSSMPQLDSLYLEAITAIASRKFPLAIKSYAEIARLSPEHAYVYFDLGRAYEKNDDAGQAIDSYLEATRRDTQYAPAFLRVGILYGRKGENQSAFGVFDKAEALYRSSGNYEGVTEVLYQRGVLFNKIGKHAEAREQLQKSLETARATTNLYQQIRSLLQLSVVSRSQGETTTAKQLATEAIELARSNGLENLTTQGLLDLGNVYFARDEADDAEKYFTQALEYAQRYNGRRNEARALLSLGSLLIQKENVDQGLVYVEQALPFFQQGVYRRETSQALLLIGRAQQVKGNYEAAFQALDEQLKIAQKDGDQPQIAFLNGDIGTVLAKQHRYPEALTHFEKSFEINSATGKKMESGFDLLNRGDMLWRLGRYQDAKPLLAQALAIAERPGETNRQLSCRVSYVKARLALSERKFPEAIAESKRAIALDDTPTKHVTIEAKYLLGLAQVYSGSKQEGKKLCQEAVQMASRASDPQLLFNALIFLSEAQLESGEAQSALENALKAQERFERTGQLDSAWHVLLIAGLSNQMLNNRDAARESLARANYRLSDLKARWGDDYFQSYLTRADVTFLKARLDKAVLATQ